jgi:outer membrane lipoprotein-sorting protein
MAFTRSGHAMSTRLRRRFAWAVPVLVSGALTAGFAVSTTSASSASPELPARSAAQLLTAVQTSAGTPLTGRIHESAALGLPDLPGAGSSASLSWQTFVTGSHDARVWVDGPDRQRIALIGQLSEADVVHNGKDVWTYTSDSNTVTHAVLRDRAGTTTAPSAHDLTPAATAARALKAIAPSTVVTVDATRTVAGRAAYTLVLRPRDTRSTVRKVTIAIDASKFVPLQVQIFGTGSKPVFQTGFSSISFARPRSGIFNFHAPAGATVSNDPAGVRSGYGRRHNGERRGAAGWSPDAASTAPTLIGSGWMSATPGSDCYTRPWSMPS